MSLGYGILGAAIGMFVGAPLFLIGSFRGWEMFPPKPGHPEYEELLERRRQGTALKFSSVIPPIAGAAIGAHFGGKDATEKCPPTENTKNTLKRRKRSTKKSRKRGR